MNYYSDIFLCIILVLFPLMVYGFYVASEDDNTQEVTLKIALLCSMYIILEMGYNMSPRIAVLASNIPILLYYIKDKPKTGFLMSMVYVYVCSKYFYIQIYITIAQYVLLLIFYIVYKKTHKNKYIFVTCFFIVKFIVYLIRRNETECFFDDHAFEDDLYITLPLTYLSSLLTIYLLTIGEKIVSRHLEFKEMIRQNELRTSLFKITHEIKNPLSVCKGYLKMIEKEEDCLNYLPIINYEIEHALLIIEDFSSLSKLKVNKRIFLLDELLDSTISNVKAMLDNLRIDLNFNREDDLVVYADYLRLNQVIVNIIKNSYEALEEKEDNKLITVNQYSDNKYVYIEIEDNGPGVTNDELIKLGEPFYTTKQKGTGLGLTLSKEIMQAHKGDLKIESKNGFKVLLSIKK